MRQLIGMTIVVCFLARATIALGYSSRGDDENGTTLNFDKDAVATLPEGWKAEGTNQKGAVATWQVMADSTAPSGPNVMALSKTNHDSGDTFNICWTDNVKFKDGEIEVQFKANTGQEDQGGGLIWRVKDKNNYYIARYNPLEENFRVYYVKDASRKQLATEKVTIPAGDWHTMKVEQHGDHIACFLDGKKYLDVKDATFTGEGGIGLWTKADAATSFDNLKVEARDNDDGTLERPQPQSSKAPISGVGQSKELDTGMIEQITGLKGALNKDENVFKVSQPRTDVHVTIDGRAMEPFMGLTTWASFMPGTTTQAMVMGDLVLFQDEVNPAMSAALDNGLAVTALHNHFFYDEPRVFFMHIGGEGTTEQLAVGVRKALDSVKAIRSVNAQLVARFGDRHIPTASSITAAQLDEILAVKGQAKDGMYKAVIGRTVKMPCGCEVGKEMGVNTWAGFAGTDDLAIVDGDFVTFEGELQPVLKSLRAADINIVAIHNHMEGESPKAIFLHYWGKGQAEELARGVKTALDAQAAAHSQHGHH